VGRILVPEGFFKSARATKSKRDDPRRNTPGIPAGPDNYPLSSGSGVLCTIFPSSGNGPQTTLAYTQDGSSRGHPMAPISAEMSALTRSAHHGIPASRTPHQYSASPHASSRHVPVPVVVPQARPSNMRTPPLLVPLEYLQACSNTRDPTDQRMLQQLSTSRTPNSDLSPSPVSPSVNPGRITPYNGFRTP
jgi:hypothetical protein